MRISKRRAVSSNLFTGLIVGGFVSVVIIALVWTNSIPATQQGTTLSFQQLVLFGGSASTHSFTNSCSGGAQLELYVQNPSPSQITIQGISIYGGGVQNATVYVALKNACLNLVEAGVSVPAGGSYQLVGFVSEPLLFASTYRCVVTFGNGQILNQSLIAQS